MRALLAALLIAQISETIEVRVTNIDVVVTDRSGHPVTGLTRDDFEIFENGRPQAVTNFYEVAPESPEQLPVTGSRLPSITGNGQPATEARQRRLIIFIDNYSIHPFQRRKIFESIDRSIDTLLRPGDEASVVVWYRGLKIEQSFTPDAALLRKAITRVQETGGGMTYESDRKHVRERCTQLFYDAQFSRNYQAAFDQCVSIVRNYSEEFEGIETHLIASADVILSTLAGLEGKKVMIYAGAALPKHPARELFIFADNLFSPYLRQFRPSAMGNLSASMTVSIEKLAKNANANGVTMYMIDGGDETRELMPSAAEQSLPDPGAAFAEYDNTASAFQAVARITGGMALTHSANFDLAMETIGRDLENYYSLGYRQNEGPKKERNVVVKVKNRPELRVRARSSYVARTVDEQLTDRVIANIYHDGKNELGIAVRTGAPKKSGRNRWSIPVEVLIPPAMFTLLPQDRELIGGFSVFVATGDQDGAMSNVTRIAKEIRIPADRKDQLLARPISFTADVTMNGGTHTLSIGVVDQVSNTSGYVRTRVVVH